MLGSTSTKYKLQILNLKEQNWLESLQQPLKVGITQIPNQVLKTKDGYSGYAIDLFKNIEDILGIKFDYVYYDTWEDVLNAAKNKKVDILFLAQKTERRLKYFDFTDAVLVQHNKILSTSKKLTDIDIHDLFHKKVAVVKASAIAEYMMLNYPQIYIYPCNSEKEIFEKLLKKEVDFTVVEPVRTSYYMRQNNINDLHISGDFPYDYKLRIASRRDFFILNIILNKAVENITLAQKKALALKWGYEKDLFFDKKLLINIAIVFIVILIFVLYLSYLNQRLKTAQKSLNQINKTLEKRVKEELEKNRQKDLAMLNQSRFAQMGQAINMIAHQWRQPLNNISIILQRLIIKCNKDDITKDEIHQFNKKAQLQIKQMSKTIDDFRDFFKYQKEKKIFSLNKILDNLIELVEPVLEKSNIKLKVTQKNEICINGYSNEFSQAVLNIIYNAKDALSKSKTDDKKITILLSQKNNQAYLTISDNAGGIPKDIIEEIFKPYFSTKGKNGTGIGLYMAKMIIEKHMDGKIKASNSQNGAVFEIVLPI